jgi:murein L,D-transpeptidase YcbB/YkuD
LRQALARVEALWGGLSVERTSLRTHMEQVRRLDLPAVLEMFHPARRDTCYLALLGLETDTALVAVGDGPPLRVPVERLDRFWTRDATFLWRDFEALGRGDDPSRAKAWTRTTLARLGYDVTGTDLDRVVGRFQRDADLVPDGIIGSRTLMALYGLSAYPRPHLESRAGGTS